MMMMMRSINIDDVASDETMVMMRGG